MMKRLLLALGLCLFGSSAWATCAVTNLQVKDNAATTASVPYADDGSGASNCSPQIQIKQGGNVVAVTAGSALKVDASATTQPVSIASAAVASGAYASGAFASGAFASGSVASGAFASGSLAVGAGTDGWDVTLGTKADTAWSSGSGTLISIAKTIANNTGAAVPAGTNVIGFTSNDPCSQSVKITVPIATSSGNVQLVAGSATKKVYICSFSLIAAATAVVNIIEGTGAACTTANEAAVIGSTTAASGMSLAANGGLTFGNGGGTIGVTATAANGICLLQSGTTALAGNITYIQQ